MKEIKTILDRYDQLDFSTRQAALATVVRVEGSSYRRVGARMLVVDDGTWTGGCLEGDALKRARLAIHKKNPSLVTYDTTEDDQHQIGVGLGCNGIIDVLFTPLDPADAHNALEWLRHYDGERSPRILLTVTAAAAGASVQMGQVFSYEKFPCLTDEIRMDAAAAMASKTSVIREYGEFSLLIEVFPPVIRLVLFGGNYDMYPLVALGKEIGWNVAVVTNIQKAGKSLFAAAAKVIDKTAEPPVDDQTAFVLMAHDYKTDKNNLKKAVQTEVRYIGVLGPRKRSEKIFAELSVEGISLPMNRIFSPIGLDLGALTPEEIALSIVAEIQAFFAGKKAGFLKEKIGAIHG